MGNTESDTLNMSRSMDIHRARGTLNKPRPVSTKGNKPVEEATYMHTVAHVAAKGVVWAGMGFGLSFTPLFIVGLVLLVGGFLMWTIALLMFILSPIAYLFGAK
jgi:hypothetical protein